MVFGGEGEEEKIEKAVFGEECEVLAWRDVPTNPDAIGKDARAVMPRIRQMFIGMAKDDFDERRETRDEKKDNETLDTETSFTHTSHVSRLTSSQSFERRLYVIRRQIEKTTMKTYVCSCSSRTIVYKGLLLATQIEKFYPDLSDPDFISPFAIVHQRYSTNTFPSWELAHPFRAIAHNGEINALKGNLNALAAREPSLAFPDSSVETASVQQQVLLHRPAPAVKTASVQQQGGSAPYQIDLRKILPLIGKGQSDSASLDNMFELLVAAGRDAPHAMMMLIPQAWGAKYHMGHDVRAF